MAVYYDESRKGGGFLDILGQALGMGSMFVPGLQPFAMGLNAINAARSGNPAGLIWSAIGLGKNMMGGGYQEPQSNSAFSDAMDSAHAANKARVFGNGEFGGAQDYSVMGEEFELFPRSSEPYARPVPFQGWGEGFEPWSWSVKPQTTNYDEFDDTYTNPWKRRYR